MADSVDGVEAFGDKRWKSALFTDADTQADNASVTEVSAWARDLPPRGGGRHSPMSDEAAAISAEEDEQAKEELEAIRATVEGLPNALAIAARLNDGVVEETTLDIRALHLVRLAALAAAGAPPIAFRVNLEAMDQHVSVDDVNSTLAAIAPIVGSARYLSAVRAIIDD